VIPRELLKKIRRIEIRTSHLVNDALAGQYHSAFRGRGMEFEEVRPYQLGDDVRSIDWNVSARVGEPFVKVFREERELTVLLVVDVSASQRFGSQGQLKRDLVAEIGATLAFSAIRNNDKVGLVTFSDRIEKHVPPAKGTAHVLRVIRELLVSLPQGRCTDIAGALEHVSRITRRRAVVFLISDLQGAGYERALRMARRRHDVIVIQVVDERELRLQRGGLMELFDQERSRLVTIDAGSRRFRESYESQRAIAQEAVLRTMRKARIDFIRINAGESYVDELVGFFRSREKRR
jgi:uncharacterized protein (DUF58 family)